MTEVIPASQVLGLLPQAPGLIRVVLWLSFRPEERLCR